MPRAISEATKDANAPTEALAAALELLEVDARAAVDASFSVSGGTATAARLDAFEAEPMAASAPPENVVVMCPDELKNSFGRTRAVVDEQRMVRPGSNCSDVASWQ